MGMESFPPFLYFLLVLFNVGQHAPSIAKPGPLQRAIIATAAEQPKGGPCFRLKSVGCFFKRARQRGGHRASEGMRSFFKGWMNQLLRNTHAVHFTVPQQVRVWHQTAH